MLATEAPLKTKEDQSNSIDENIKQKTLTTDHRETSTDDVKSFVIVNDINVEEELSKAQKDNQNYFQVLSMSFYGRMRSHSFDNQESREVQQPPQTPQNETKTALTRKRSAQTPSESKLSASKEMKPKTISLAKKPALATKELELIPEKGQKRMLSPKVDIGKMYSPLVAGKKALVGNFTTKAAGKKESNFTFEGQQRPQTGKKPSGSKGVDDSTKAAGITADMIMSSSGRSTPLRVEFPKKISVSKLAKSAKKAAENIEEKVQTLSMEPSVLDIQEFQDNGDDRDGNSCQDSTSKDGRTVKKNTSRRGSDKNLKDKAVVVNNFVKGSSTKSQPKINLKEGQDMKDFLLKEKSSTPLGVSSSNKEIKRGKKITKKKANSQESNIDFSEEKLRNLIIGDLQDSGDDDEKSKTGKSDTSKTTTTKKKSSVKLDRQRSPDAGKLFERIPTILGNGVGDLEMKTAMVTKYDLTRKSSQKDKEKEKEGGFFEAKKTDSPSLKELVKSKKSSMEKLGKGDKPVQLTVQVNQPNQAGVVKEKKPEGNSPVKDGNTKKIDIGSMTSPKEVKSVKLGDVKMKEKTVSKEKARAASPMSGEVKKQGELLDKILIKKKEKI